MSGITSTDPKTMAFEFEGEGRCLLLVLDEDVGEGEEEVFFGGSLRGWRLVSRLDEEAEDEL